jgi:2-dehydro-3-deoxy-D-gluconate 5-dehydrogenase
VFGLEVELRDISTSITICYDKVMTKPISELLNLSGKSAIVTGGAKGIGQGVAYRLAEAGAKVLIADIDMVAAEQTAQELASKGWTAEAFKVDVSDEADVQNMIKTCQDKFGSVDILVNNAGIYPPMPVAMMTAEQFERVQHVNLRSVFLTTKYASEVMKTQGGGRIINITSIDALHPSMVGLAHYDASKHGAWGFTKNSALELAAHNIWVNAIAPGGIATPGVAAMSQGASAEQMEASTKAFMAKIPMHRMGESDEIGTVALFLASDMANYMTGEQIVVDGGALLS